MTGNPRPLNETDRDYLEGNEVEGSYSDRPDKLNNRIKEKVNGLPERFEQLFRDTRLLTREEYLEGKTWADGWMHLLDIRPEDRSAPLDYTPPQRTVTGSVSSSSSAPERLGEKLGRTAARVVSLRTTTTDEILREVVWGFMKGVWRHPDEERMLESIDEISRTLSRRAREEIRFYEETRRENQQSFKHSWEDSETAREYIKEILDLDETESRNWLVQQVNRHLRQNSNAESKPVATIVEENQLLPKQQLINALRADARRICDKSGKGPEGTETLLCVFENQNSSSRTVSEKLKGDRRWTGGVTGIARDLAGQGENSSDTPERDVWTERPILRGNKEEWRTTAYGSALSQYLQAPESYRQLRPLEVIRGETVSDAIRELGLFPV